MLEEILIRFGITGRFTVINIVVVSNAFIWYFLVFSILKMIITEITVLLWSVHFAGAIVSAVIGAVLSERIRRKTFFISWMMLGVISSFILSCVTFTSVLNILLISLFTGVAFGIGVPASLGCFAEHTAIENRAKLGGLILFINSIGTFLLGLIMSGDITLNGFILAIWRLSGLIIFLLFEPPSESMNNRRNVSFGFILHRRSFVVYLLPWVMFSLVNYLSVPVLNKLFTAELVESIVIIESTLAGFFAIMGGFLSDIFGRKRMSIIGFVMLGLGYAVLGIYPENLLNWYFYILVDSIAWGLFHVIYIFTIWGDLSEGVSTGKYYAIGGLPFYVSNFLRILIGPYIAEAVSAYAIFSFTALFMFLATLPLMFAMETLPEKTLRERELRSYIEKAKRVREKFTKG
ncbi:MAG: MFS transporter [Candidatus Bathyarchaeia archaeon]